MADILPRHQRAIPLTKEHDKTAFDCGKSPLNEYLVKYALQNQSAAQRDVCGPS